MEAHNKTAEQLSNRKSDLTNAEPKLAKASTAMTQVKADLDAAKKKVVGHSFILSNKDMEITKLREKL